MLVHSKRNDFGGDSISKILYDWLLANLPRGHTILELGSGWGTSQLVKHWNVYSVEDNPDYVGLHHDQYFEVPLKAHDVIPGHEGKRHTASQWYDPDLLSSCIYNLNYDLLLVDGPYHNRAGFIKYFDLFKHDVPILFDDIRKNKVGHGAFEPNKIITDISEMLDRPFEIHGEGRNMFGVVK